MSTKPTFDPKDPNSKLYAIRGGGKKPTTLKPFIFVGTFILIVILLIVLL